MDEFTALADGSVELIRHMATTQSDYLRLLSAATEGRACRVAGTEISIEVADGKRLAISLGPESVRRIGPTVAMPHLSVRYRFIGMTRGEIAAFLAGFDRYYQRGGG